MLLRLEQEVSALGATIKKRREELQEVTHSNAVEMDAIKTKAAEATAKAKEDHERKVSSARGGTAHVFDCSKDATTGTAEHRSGRAAGAA